MKGPVLRARSPFAQRLSAARQDTDGRRLSYVPSAGARRASQPYSEANEADAEKARRRLSRRQSGTQARGEQTRRVSDTMGSRRNSQTAL